jgi:hypothetical protein
MAVAVRFLAALIGLIVGAGVGWVIGATYGGNYAVDFEFAGGRGYEATGPLGAMIGAPTIALVCIVIVWRPTSRWWRAAPVDKMK